MYGHMYNNLLVSFISYEARYKEYHHQNLALKSSNFCHTPAYLVTLLHSNNVEDGKELMVYIRKKCCKGSCCVNFIIVLKKDVFIFNATFSRGWCINSVAAYSELLDESKIHIFLKICRSIVLL